MTATLVRPPAAVAAPENGGLPARRAVARWAWRLFRREWRQQLLVLGLIVVAVAATVLGATVATNTPAPVHAGFGTAQDLATFQGQPSQPSKVGAEVGAVRGRFGRVDVIENQTLSIPGSITTYDLRAQDPHGAFGRPMLSLVSGSYPAGAGQVALTSGLASTFGLHVGGVWHHGSSALHVVGIVENPQSLLDEFALVPPGHVTAPTQVTVLFDAHGADVASLGPNFESATGVAAAASNALNPETIVLALATLGMLLIALVSVGGFTVLAQRRLRSIGMLGALGATDRHIRLVVRANGAVVGVAGALLGAVLGLLAWLVYRPHVETSSHHLIGMFALPWAVILPSMVLAVVATYLAAARPARAVAKVPIVTALSGRPAPPKRLHRSVVPGLVVLVVSFLLLGYSGAQQGGTGSGMPELLLGLVLLIAAVVLLAPLFLAVLARAGRRAPIAVRMALRDLARFRARSGSALAAISLGVLIAVIICVLAASRYGNVLDYAGPNLASNQLIVTLAAPSGPGPSIGPKDGGPGPSSGPTRSTLVAEAKSAHQLAAVLGTHDVLALATTDASLQHDGPGRQFNGQVYVATPQLLKAFGIKASDLQPSADILTSRQGLASVSNMQLVYGNYFQNLQVRPGGPSGNFPCPKSDCVANPTVQQLGALPLGVSAPNVVITEHAIHELGLQVPSESDTWLIQTPQPLTASEINSARLTAAAAGLAVETKNDAPTSSQVIDWATLFGIALALCILAMTVGLIRSETASDLRILTAAGAGSSTRRALTAATCGGLAFLGALLGTVAAYVATIGYLRNNSLNGLSSLGNVPIANLLVILIGMPVVAVVGGWLLSGREPSGVAQQPLE